jgi:glycosyltransferase involved in cell wall biosynthesis
LLNNLQSEVADEDGTVHLRTANVGPSPNHRRQKRICIIGLGSVSQNPRVIKEADALAAAGYDVVVLFLQHFAWEQPLDRRILEQAKWRAEIVEVLPSIGGRVRRWLSALQLLLFRRLCRWTMRFPMAELAYSRYFLVLSWRAIRHRGDLYIGHYTGSLPVVYLAAWMNGTKFGFDFEDFHRGEANPFQAGSFILNRLITVLEDRYLPRASFVTAASRCIAEEIGKTTGLPPPTTVLNVFPWADRARLPAPNAQPPASLSLYWFSQIVSLDRGLQDVIGAMALMRERAELHIRGDDMEGSIESLRNLAKERGVSERIHFHATVSPEDLLAAAAEYDIGLCLEVPATPNRNLCVTNKIFVYMLAGLAIVASRTKGHLEVLNASPKIGLLYDCGDITTLATILDRYATDRTLLASTKEAALAAVRERWNWEQESKIVIGTVDRVFAEEMATKRCSGGKC